jgi:alpha-ribazole phosphatase
LSPGWPDLVESWSAQLAAVAPERIWTSPALRCAAVASVLSDRLRLPLSQDNRLLELDFGDWEGQCWDGLPRAALDRWAADPAGFRPPGGESGADLMGRVTAFADQLRRESRSCIVVSHGGPLRVLRPLLRGEAVDLLAASPALGALELLQVLS